MSETPASGAPGSERDATSATPGEARIPEGDATHVSDDALATLIGLAAHEVPGVVGMAPAYGVNIPVVAESVVQRVRYAARHYGGVEVDDVQVHVAGVSRG